MNSLDTLVTFYRIDIGGKKWYWSHYININDALNSETFKVFKLVNLDAKMDFLAFICQVAMHYLKAAAPENERTQENHFVEKYSQKRYIVGRNWSRAWRPIFKVGLCIETCFTAFHMS